MEIPDVIKDLFINEAQVPEDNDIATIKDVSRVAMLLFVGYIALPPRCPNHVAEVVAPHRPQVGARIMMRTNANTLAVV